MKYRGAQKLIPTEFLYIQGAQKLIPAKFSTLLRSQGAQKLIRAEFSTNKVISRNDSDAILSGLHTIGCKN